MNGRHRRRWLPGLVLAVALGHAWIVDGVLQSGAQLGPGASKLARIEVAFVKELQPTEPAAVPTPRRVAPLRAPPRAAAPLPPASAPASAPALQPPPLEMPALASLPESPVSPPPPAEGASAPEGAALQAAPTMAAAVVPDAAASFEWPPSTRLSYRLTGYYRGPVDGQAQVEWLREGSRYQVRLEVGVGPSFAPLMSRRMVSDGRLTERGLQPRLYEEETRVVLRTGRRAAIVFDEAFVSLPGVRRVEAPVGVQDTASQFVQLTWLFTTQPSLLQTGRSVDIPLALPRRVDLWTYDVLERESLDTPAGPVEAVHVKPRREARSGSDLTAEMWVAPSLQYLPVRIVIRQDAETFLDLKIDRLPEQALQPAAPSPGTLPGGAAAGSAPTAR